MKINISHIAKLANLKISNDKKNQLEQQLEETIDYINQLQEVDTTGILETNQVTGLLNVTRDDKSSKSFTQKEAFLNSKNEYKGYFKVDAILEK